MRFSKDCLRISGLLEGTRHKAYQDGNGVWTIGRGHTLNVKPGMTATDAQIDAWERQDFMRADAAIKHLVARDLTQAQIDALGLFVMNKGVTAFERSTLLVRINAGQLDDVPHQLSRWHFDNGKDVDGLRVRAAVEQYVWLGLAPKINEQFIAVLRGMVA